MVLLNAKPTQLAILVGHYVSSSGFTDVIGGTLTAGTADSEGSALITWAPAMISAPKIFLQPRSGGSANVLDFNAFATGVTVSNAYIAQCLSGGQTASTATGVDVLIIGEARL